MESNEFSRFGIKEKGENKTRNSEIKDSSGIGVLFKKIGYLVTHCFHL